MKRRKGFTFLEMIFAFVMLTLIVIFFINIISQQYMMLIKSKSITTTTYSAMEKTEREIQDIKDMLEEGKPDSDIPFDKMTVDIFSSSASDKRTVALFKLKNIINNPPNANADHNNYILTFIMNRKRMQLPVPKINKAWINFFDNGVFIDKVVASFFKPKIVLQGEHDDIDNEDLHLTTIYQWYVSRKGFNGLYRDEIKESDIDKIYPHYRNDYIILPGETNKSLRLDELFQHKDYKGRHFILSAKPASNLGKIGEEAVTYPPVFIMGLPVLSNLVCYFDASIFSTNEDADSQGDATDLYLKKWIDLHGGNDALSEGNPTRPKVVVEKFGMTKNDELLGPSGNIFDIYSRLIRFDGSGELKIKPLIPNVQKGLNLKEFTVFAVAKATGDNNSIMTGRNFYTHYKFWELGFDGFTIRTNNNDASVKRIPLSLEKDKWYVIKADSSLNVNVNNQDMGSVSSSGLGNITDMGDIYIGRNKDGVKSNVDIAEIILYKGIMTTSDVELVNKYLMDKYGIPF